MLVSEWATAPPQRPQKGVCITRSLMTLKDQWLCAVFTEGGDKFTLRDSRVGTILLFTSGGIKTGTCPFKKN